MMPPATRGPWTLRLVTPSLLLLIASGSTPGTLAADAAWPPMPARGTDAKPEVRHTLTFDGADLRISELNGYAVLRLGETGTPPAAGQPALPAHTICIAVPAGMRVTEARAAAVRRTEIPGMFRLYPSQLPQPIAGELAAPPLATPDPAVYASTTPYPPELACLIAQADLAGQSIALVRVHPLQWLPATGALSLATELEIVLSGEPGYVCRDHLPSSASPRVRAIYERMLRAMVTNPQDVRLGIDVAGTAAMGGHALEPGSYDYVIITRADWVDDFQPLADWRTREGVPATIVSTEWIYAEGGYSGTFLEQIRAFIADAHATWGAADFVLGGDSDLFPYHIRTITIPGYSTDDVPNYTYYADYDEDWFCEVNLGNASVRSPAQIADFIDKVFTYEKSPPLTEYATHAAFFGFDIGSCGDNYGETSKEDYIRAHLPPAWALSTEYDSEPGVHEADVIAYLNQGHHLVNHHDHCNTYLMGAGWICHGDLLEVSDVIALTNGDRQSILFAVGCNPADFPGYTCIGEAFLRHTGGGAVAFMGNTRTGWGGTVEDPDHYTLRQDRYFYRNLFDLGIERLGQNFTLLKNDAFDPYDPLNLHKYVFTQLHLLGDPGLRVWTDDPRPLTVVHDDGVNAGVPRTFVVDVSSDRTPLDGACVCLWKESEVYAIEETVGGIAVFELPAMTEGTLLVTVTLHNYLPYEGQALVATDPSVTSEEASGLPLRLALTAVRPNPLGPATAITFALPAGGDRRVNLTVLDCTGRRVRTLIDADQPPGIHTVTWQAVADNARSLPSGIYFAELRWNGELRTRRLALIR